GRLPDAAAGGADVDGVARGVGRVDRDAADAARVAVERGRLAGRRRQADRGRADGRPGGAREPVGRVVREDPEAGRRLVGDWLAQAGDRRVLLEAQRPAIETAPAGPVVLDQQGPGPGAELAVERAERLLRLELAEERRPAVLDRRRGGVG